MLSVNQSKNFLGSLSSGTTARSTGDSQLMSSKYSSHRKRLLEQVSGGGGEIWSVILLMSRLP